MQELDDHALLRAYATRNSETAFETLVSRRVSFVYAAALRQVRDPHLAEEVTQAVFVILARKAGKISDQTVLSGWLFKTTRFTALAQTRASIKRQHQEQEAYMQSKINQTSSPQWEQMWPVLDEALATLRESDRQAVLLRFFENKNLAEVGNQLGTTEDSARKRVSRAVEKLQKFFAKRGMGSSVAIIASAMSACSTQASPALLTKSVTEIALAHGTAASGSTIVLINAASKLMAWAKIKAAIIGAVVIAGMVTTTIVISHHPEAFLATDSSRKWDRDSFRYAGYETPQATLRTTLWAMSNGDTNAFLATCAPEEKLRRINEWQGKSREVLAAEGKSQLAGVTGVEIVNQTNIAADWVVLTVYLKGQEKNVRITLRKMTDGWKRTQ